MPQLPHMTKKPFSVFLTVISWAPQCGHVNILGNVLLGLRITFLFLLRLPMAPRAGRFINMKSALAPPVTTHRNPDGITALYLLNVFKLDAAWGLCGIFQA